MIRPDPATLAPAPTDAEIARQYAMLTQLAEIGMEIAAEAGRQATGREAADAAPEGAPPDAPQPPPMRDPALVYTRVARAICMTIALQSRLTGDLVDLGRAEAVSRAGRRRRLERLVERAVETEPAEGDEGCEGEALGRRRDEARERLADAEIDADIDGLSFAEVVARICGDLGLSPERAGRIVAAAQDCQGPPAARPQPGPGGECRLKLGPAVLATRPAEAAAPCNPDPHTNGDPRWPTG